MGARPSVPCGAAQASSRQTLCPQPFETHRHQRKSRPTWAGAGVYTVPAAESLTLPTRPISCAPQLTLLKITDDNNYLTGIHGDERKAVLLVVPEQGAPYQHENSGLFLLSQHKGHEAPPGDLASWACVLVGDRTSNLLVPRATLNRPRPTGPGTCNLI